MSTEQDTPVDAGLRDTITATMIAMLPALLDHHTPITPQALLQDELGLSSSLVLEVLLGIEEAHNIQIDLETMDEDQVTTVADLAAFIADHHTPL